MSTFESVMNRSGFPCIFLLSLLAVLLASGCDKSEKPPQPASAQTVDLVKLRQAFPSPTPEIKRSVDQIRFAVDYRNYDKALAELDNLAGNTSLTETQKQAVAAAIEQAKQAQQKTTPPPPTQ